MEPAWPRHKRRKPRPWKPPPPLFRVGFRRNRLRTFLLKQRPHWKGKLRVRPHIITVIGIGSVHTWSHGFTIHDGDNRSVWELSRNEIMSLIEDLDDMAAGRLAFA